MSAGVEFEEDKFSYGSPKPSGYGINSGGYSFSNQNSEYANEPAMVRFLLKHGLAKTPRSAQIFLTVLAIINFIISIIVAVLFIF